MDRVKVLAIAGSPRRDGNTDILLREVVAGACSRGASVDTIILCDLDIAPCRHCDGCRETGCCVVPDDMPGIHTKLRETDRLVLASPIFFLGVTAQTKAMIDRCQALWSLKYVLKLPVATNSGGERRGLFVSVGGRKAAGNFEPAIATVRAFFAVLDFAYAGELIYPGVDEKGEITHHPTALQDAFDAGVKLANTF